MNVKFLNPFLEATAEVVKTETGYDLKRGDLKLEEKPYATGEVTTIIAMVGGVEGNVFISMSRDTALQLATRMMREKFDEFDGLAQSGIAELGNVITGRASVKLSATGYEATISPPTMLMGAGAVISTLDFHRLVVPFYAECGEIVIHLALREGRSSAVNAAQIPVPRRPSL